MEFHILEIANKKVVECVSDSGVIGGEVDALELVGLCGGEDSRWLLVHESNFHPDFFDLKTGVAGQVLLKWTNYGLQVAAIISPERIGTGRFFEMVIESNRRNDFRVFSSRAESLEWFAGL